MRNLIKKILIETTENSDEDLEIKTKFTNTLLNKVESFFKNTTLSDNVCGIFLSPVYTNKSIIIFPILKNKWEGREEERLLKKKVNAVFSNFNVTFMEWYGDINNPCEPFIENFKSILKSQPDYIGRMVTPKNNNKGINENDDKDLIINRAIKKAIDLELKHPHYNKDKTKILILNKNKKCLVQYDIKNKKLWYDNSFLDKIMTMIVTKGYIGDEFKEALKEWFNYEFKKHGYHVDPNKKVEGANIYLY
jgi:hypothetical protein